MQKGPNVFNRRRDILRRPHLVLLQSVMCYFDRCHVSSPFEECLPFSCLRTFFVLKRASHPIPGSPTRSNFSVRSTYTTHRKKVEFRHLSTAGDVATWQCLFVFAAHSICADMQNDLPTIWIFPKNKIKHILRSHPPGGCDHTRFCLRFADIFVMIIWNQNRKIASPDEEMSFACIFHGKENLLFFCDARLPGLRNMHGER